MLSFDHDDTAERPPWRGSGGLWMNVSLLRGRLARRLALEGASPRIKRICADAHIRIYAHTYHNVCARACVCACVRVYIQNWPFKLTQTRQCRASPPPALHLPPPQNDLGQSYSASTSSSVLQRFSSPLSINPPPSPHLHAVDSISPPTFAAEACNICNHRGPVVSWKNACRR